MIDTRIVMEVVIRITIVTMNDGDDDNKDNVTMIVIISFKEKKFV